MTSLNAVLTTLLCPFGGFFSCLFVLLSLSVLVLLASVFLSVVSLAWLCLLAAALGRCVRLLVRSLARLSGRSSCLVRLLLLLLWLALGWLALRWRFVLLSALSLARFGSSLCLSCVESSRWGFVPLLGARSLAPYVGAGSHRFFLAIALSISILKVRSRSVCSLHKRK
jgi:hypothetical protein